MDSIHTIVRPVVAIVIAYAETNWAAYAPAIPGVAATGATPAECRRSMEEALTFHLERLAEDAAPLLARLAEEARSEMKAAASDSQR